MPFEIVDDSFFQRETIKYLNKIDNQLKTEKVYEKLDIKCENVTSDDVIIEPGKKKITIKNEITINGFLTYLHSIWYSDKILCTMRFPFRNKLRKIEKKYNWSIYGQKKIITPEQALNMWREFEKEQ